MATAKDDPVSTEEHERVREQARAHEVAAAELAGDATVLERLGYADYAEAFQEMSRESTIESLKLRAKVGRLAG